MIRSPQAAHGGMRPDGQSSIGHMWSLAGCCAAYRHRELREISIRHFLFVTDVHACMLLLTCSGPITLVDWQESPRLAPFIRVGYTTANGSATDSHAILTGDLMAE
jgi:hypothetical protein